MPGAEFLTLHEGQPQRRPTTPGAVRPPPPPPLASYGGQQSLRGNGGQYPVHQSAGQYPRPVVSQAPQQQQHQLQRQQGHQTVVVQPNSSVKVCDIRTQRPPTEAETRESLSEYHVYRWTKDDEGDGYASDGTRRKATWKRALRRPVSLSKQQAAETVYKLGREHKVSVTQKKEDLSEDQQRHVEEALEELKRQHDDAFFETTLVQLDDRVKVVKPTEKDARERERERERERQREKDRRKDRHRRESRLFGPSRAPAKPSSRARDTKKEVIRQRVSFTAYFKRAPRPDIDHATLLQYLDAQRDARIKTAYAQTTRPDDGRYPASRHVDARGSSPTGHHAQAYYPQSRGGGTAIVHPAPQRQPYAVARGRFSPDRLSPHIRNGAHSPSSTDESIHSEIFSGEDDTLCTSPSTASYASSRGSYERPGAGPALKPGGVFREDPAHYGIRAPVIQPHGPNDGRRMRQGAVGNPSYPQPQSANGYFAGRHPSAPPPIQIPTSIPTPPVPVQIHPAGPAGPAPPFAGAPQPVPVPGQPPHYIPQHQMNQHQMNQHQMNQHQMNQHQMNQQQQQQQQQQQHAPVPQHPGMGMNPGMNPGMGPNPNMPMMVNPLNPAAGVGAGVGQLPALDPRQIAEKAYAAGRADTAERIAVAAAATAVPPGANNNTRGPGAQGRVVVDQQGRGRGQERGGRRDDESTASESSGSDTDEEEERDSGRERERGRNRSPPRRKGDDGRPRRGNSHNGRHGSSSRGRSLSHERDDDRDYRRQQRSRGGRSPTRSRTRSLSLDNRDRDRDRDRERSRGWDHRPLRSRNNTPPPLRNSYPSHRHQRPLPSAIAKPRSGVRFVQPAHGGYTRPRVGMGREDLARGMGRLRVDDRDIDDDEEDWEEELDEEEEEEELFEERVRGSGEYESRAQRLRREEGQLLREERERERREAAALRRARERAAGERERGGGGGFGGAGGAGGGGGVGRRRDSGVDLRVDVGAAPYGDRNPFAPRPVLGRRNAGYSGYGAGRPGDGFVTL